MAPPPDGITHLADPGGRAAIRLDAAGGNAVVAATGAQVLSWRTPHGEMLWTASRPEYAAHKPVRGGVPLVFPWFGDHAARTDLPAHGFARNLEWRVAAEHAGPEVVLVAEHDATTLAMWPHAFRAQLSVALAAELTIAMTVENRGDAPFRFEQALHSYFAVGDVATASVHGLDGVPFVEQARGGEVGADRGTPVRFAGETDRIYQGTPDTLVLHAPTLRRTLRLRTQGARSAIVWNPWMTKTARLSQMAPDDWRAFCCIESANVREHAVELAPGQRHTLALHVAVAQEP